MKTGSLLVAAAIVLATARLGTGAPDVAGPAPAPAPGPARPHRLVVIDPGHGGSNPGALGTTGLAEKQLTLALARAVRDQLVAGGVEVILTQKFTGTHAPPGVLRERYLAALRHPAVWHCRGHPAGLPR